MFLWHNLKVAILLHFISYLSILLFCCNEFLLFFYVAFKTMAERKKKRETHIKILHFSACFYYFEDKGLCVFVQFIDEIRKMWMRLKIVFIFVAMFCRVISIANCNCLCLNRIPIASACLCVVGQFTTIFITAIKIIHLWLINDFRALLP